MKKNKSKFFLLSLLLIFSFPAKSYVISSIKPIGFITEAISQHVVETKILLPQNASPHDYSLKPSNIQQLNKAKLVIWVGHELESFLEKPIAKLDQEKVITLTKLPEIEAQIKKIENDVSIKNGNNEHHHNHEIDAHIWLSPKISLSIAKIMHEKLIKLYPEQKAQLDKNLLLFAQDLQNTVNKIQEKLDPVKDKKFFVFHDAYNYFNNFFGLHQTGAFTINPLIQPSAKSLLLIKQVVNEHPFVCLFSEPQFSPKIIDKIAENTTAKIGMLDPNGTEIELNSKSYINFLNQLTDQYLDCLG